MIWWWSTVEWRGVYGVSAHSCMYRGTLFVHKGAVVGHRCARGLHHLIDYYCQATGKLGSASRAKRAATLWRLFFNRPLCRAGTGHAPPLTDYRFCRKPPPTIFLFPPFFTCQPPTAHALSGAHSVVSHHACGALCNHGNASFMRMLRFIYSKTSPFLSFFLFLDSMWHRHLSHRVVFRLSLWAACFSLSWHIRVVTHTVHTS